jgi:hypothetical protein
MKHVNAPHSKLYKFTPQRHENQSPPPKKIALHGTSCKTLKKIYCYFSSTNQNLLFHVDYIFNLLATLINIHVTFSYKLKIHNVIFICHQFSGVEVHIFINIGC